MFFGRIEELGELNARYNTNKFEFGIVYGARRIGKTSLIKEFLRGKKHIYFQAKQVNDYDNLISFSKQIAYTFNLPTSIKFDNYENLLDFIIKQKTEKNLY